MWQEMVRSLTEDWACGIVMKSHLPCFRQM